MHFGAVKWTCTASVIRPGVGRIISKLRMGDVPPALRAPEATPVSTDEEEPRDTRDLLCASASPQDVEQALVSSAADEGDINHEAEATVKENERADLPGEGTDGDLRSFIHNVVPQGVGAFEDVSPRGSEELSRSDVVTHGLWSSHFPWGIG